MAIKRTPEQEAAVKNRGGGLLVSAAAGSGKTRVLVERLLDRILYENQNIDQFLIITFTRAAAEELRARIAKELAQALAEDPDNGHLRRQTALLYKTQISTIHALCTVLLRQWGHILDIPADFGLCEDEEAQVLMTRTLDQVLEDRYESIDPSGPFACLLDTLSAGRDDSRLMDIVLDVYGKIQSHPNPEAWLDAQTQELELDGVKDLKETSWGALLLEEAWQTTEYWAGQMRRACELAAGDEVLERAYRESLEQTYEDLLLFSQAAHTGWDAASRQSVSFPRLKGAKGVEDTEAQEQIKSIRTRCKKAIQSLEQQISDNSAALLSDLAVVRPAMQGLIALVKDFSAAYTQQKRSRSLLDFSDLEHCAIRLLVDDSGKPTDLAQQWGDQFTEIMVDEYQDTNQVQNTIVQALSHAGKNLFMVGDVKQSIYRFRLADPTIFLEKYRTFAPWTQAQEGEERKITMSKNFRSRPEVLDAVNDLFRGIMSRRLGEMDYTDAEALYPGGTFPEGSGYETELHILDFSEDPAHTEEKEGYNLLEARFVARRIAALLEEGFPVSDGNGGLRPLRPEDIAILMRSPNPVRQNYIQALEEQEIGWSAEEGTDFFQTTEISVALSWLQILDNPQQDIPLLAVLRSPVCGFTSDRLAEIRTKSEGNFYSALQAAAEAGEPDCIDFLNDLEELRFGAGEQSSDRLLWALYRRTNMLELFGAMPGGEKRRNNLLSFYALARRFEGAGHKGLFGFLLHLERVQNSGGVSLSAVPTKDGGGVKLLSIHRSKGLEYPVVFLSGLGRRFNYSDLQKPVLFHPKLGLGPKGIDRETMVEFPTVAREGVALALRKELLAEEMRLLYVGMTRAKEKLILTHSLSYGKSDLTKLAEKNLVYPVDPRVLASCVSAGQWIILAAMARPEAESLREAAGSVGAFGGDHSFGLPWNIVYHSGSVSQEVIGRTVTEEAASSPVSAEEVIDQLRWQYPFQTAAATPAKVTATQVQGEAPEEPGLFLMDREPREPKPFYRPQFAQEALGLTAAQRGTALHTAMQNIVLSRTETVQTIRQELARMESQGYLTPQQAKAVDAGAMARFFASPLGLEVRNSSTLHREFPFSVLTEGTRFFPNTPPGDQVLLQGMIDCWFEGPEGLTLLDFKTDRVSAAGAVERSQRYSGQMAAYAYALEQMTGKPVVRQVLWYLYPSKGVILTGKDEKKWVLFSKKQLLF